MLASQLRMGQAQTKGVHAAPSKNHLKFQFKCMRNKALCLQVTKALVEWSERKENEKKKLKEEFDTEKEKKLQEAKTIMDTYQVGFIRSQRVAECILGI